MRNYKVPLSKTNWKNNLLEDYLNGSDFLQTFYQYEPNFENLEQAISDRRKFVVDRELLVEVLLDQNKNYLQLGNLQQRISSLIDSNTFTITTGHQLGIAGGPLFFIYKIITTIKLAQQLTDQNKQEKFVPVFWMATEDHDFEEIASVRVFQNKLTWDLQNPAGACGEMATDSLNDLINQLRAINGDSLNAAYLNKILKDCYQAGLNLSEATRKFVYSLLGEFGIVVIDANDARLKSTFVKEMRDELLNQTAHAKVTETSDRLSLKYRPQVFPRELNLFYKDTNLRERFVNHHNGVFNVTNTDLFFSNDILLDMLDRYPERFSPNVIMRPLYQEKILPNIAYIGGAGELAYWLQLKSLFEYHQLFFPMLVNRNNALIITEKLLKKALAIGVHEDEIFQGEQALIKLVIERQEKNNFDLADSKNKLAEEFNSIATKALTIDPTLERYIQAERQKTINALENIEKKMLQAIKKKNENALNICKQIVDEVFPDNHPQEREQSIVPFFLKEGVEGIRYFMNHIEPFSNEILVVVTE
ncbi:MAG: bacillithiol biosynthesis cysteine-adding enzyme BshC [Bacteroidota bacterium]